jgi:hypothetical protein
MSKMDTPYIPPRVTKYSYAGGYPDSMKADIIALRSEIQGSQFPGEDDDAGYTMVVDTDSRPLEFGLAPPIHEVCDSCWRPAVMQPLGRKGRGEGALCCFCGVFTMSGKQVAYWALDAICENKH